MDLDLREKTESDLERLIERRDKERRQTEGERREHELWQTSVDRFHQQARQENREKWRRFHEGMCVLHSQLAAEHQEKAERLCQDEPKGAA